MDTAGDPLAGLLARAARADDRAFAELYRRTSAKLFGLAIRILRREDWAEEVVQDCFVSIWSNARNYNPGVATPMTWMTTIVRNRCLDWLRRPRIEISADAADAADDAGDAPGLDRYAADGPGPLDRLLEDASSRAVAECLGRLEGKQRQAIALAFYDGLTHAELAAHMREPLGTVKTWIRRGLAKLKECLG